jgi:hypothetical protein
MKHALKKVLAVLIVAGFAAPAVSFADMHRDNRHAPVRATIRQAPVGNGLPRAVQTVFGLHLSCRLLMPVLHRVPVLSRTA